MRSDRAYRKKLNQIVDDLFSAAAAEGWSWVQFAEASGLAVSTVYNLGDRTTVLPRFKTVFLLAQSLNMDVMLTSLAQARRAAS